MIKTWQFFVALVFYVATGGIYLTASQPLIAVFTAIAALYWTYEAYRKGQEKRRDELFERPIPTPVPEPKPDPAEPAPESKPDPEPAPAPENSAPEPAPTVEPADKPAKKARKKPSTRKKK